MFGKKLPENRQQTFVAQKHLPRWFDELNAVLRQLRAEFLMPKPFSRIQLEGALDALVVEIHKTVFLAVPADVVNENGFGFHAGLFAGVAQIENRHLILGQFLDATEMNRPWLCSRNAGHRPGELRESVRFCRDGARLSGKAFPRRDEPLVNGIKLVGVRMPFLQPEPLRYGSLDQRGRRVGIVDRKSTRLNS